MSEVADRIAALGQWSVRAALARIASSPDPAIAAAAIEAIEWAEARQANRGD